MNWSISSNGLPYILSGNGSNFRGNRAPSSTCTLERGLKPYSRINCTCRDSFLSCDLSEYATILAPEFNQTSQKSWKEREKKTKTRLMQSTCNTQKRTKVTKNLDMRSGNSAWIHLLHWKLGMKIGINSSVVWDIDYIAFLWILQQKPN